MAPGVGTGRAALVAVLAVATAVRLPGLDDRLSPDEGYSWLVASAPDAAAFLDRLAAYENTPPLPYLLLVPLPLEGEEWLRLMALIPAVASVAVLYAAVRSMLGTRTALLAALGLAVAPYHISFSNYSRGFALATLGLSLALWAAARLGGGAGRRWWWLWAAGGVVAVYSEYYAALGLAALAAGLLALGTPRRREVVALAGLPVLALLPWLPEMLASLDALDETKVAPAYPAPGPGAGRDVIVAVLFGEHGAASAPALRSAQALLVAAALIAAATVLWRRSRTAFWLLPGTAAAVLALHALTAAIGPDVFAQRYLTFVLPLAAATLAAGALSVRALPAARLALAALAGLAVAVLVTRSGRELEPDPRRVEPVLGRGADRVLTNSATVAFYLRARRPVLDRPFGLIATPPPADARWVAVDDARVAGPPRAGRVVARSGPFTVRRPAR